MAIFSYSSSVVSDEQQGRDFGGGSYRVSAQGVSRFPVRLSCGRLDGYQKWEMHLR